MKPTEFIEWSTPVKVVSGYRNLQDFRDRIDPYFIGRTPEEVGEQLPEITPKEYVVELTKEEKQIYRTEVLAAVKEAKEKNLPKGQAVFTALRLALCPAIVDTYEEEWKNKRSTKEEELLELLKDEFSSEKIVIFANSKKWINRYQKILASEGIASVKITGDEDGEERSKNVNAFNKNDEIKVCLITAAGEKGINLQSARIMIFAQMPWSYGSFKQLLGRIRRLGTKHQSLLCVFLVAKATADARVSAALKGKKKLFGEIFNDSLETIESDDSQSLEELYKQISSDLGVQ